MESAVQLRNLEIVANALALGAMQINSAVFLVGANVRSLDHT
jgi:hypothetical protein